MGRALQDFFTDDEMLDECVQDEETGEVLCRAVAECVVADLRISTKIPPWSLTSIDDIQEHARNSREELVGFCQDIVVDEDVGSSRLPFPLDVYYIHGAYVSQNCII